MYKPNECQLFVCFQISHYVIKIHEIILVPHSTLKTDHWAQWVRVFAIFSSGPGFHSQHKCWSTTAYIIVVSGNFIPFTDMAFMWYIHIHGGKTHKKSFVFLTVLGTLYSKSWVFWLKETCKHVKSRPL